LKVRNFEIWWAEAKTYRNSWYFVVWCGNVLLKNLKQNTVPLLLFKVWWLRACIKHFPALRFCIIRLVQSTSSTTIPARFAETELQITIELRTTAPEISAPKPDLRAKAKSGPFLAPKKENHLRHNYENLLTNHYRNVTLMQPLQYDL